MWKDYSDGPGTPSSGRKNSRHGGTVKDNDKVMGQLIGRFIGMTVVEIRV